MVSKKKQTKNAVLELDLASAGKPVPFSPSPAPRAPANKASATGEPGGGGGDGGEVPLPGGDLRRRPAHSPRSCPFQALRKLNLTKSASLPGKVEPVRPHN